jgi:hypothetical protein
MYKSILLIPDQHFPYNAPDIVAFLSAISKKYKPDKVINLGDEIDGHSWSFHQHEGELYSPGDELQAAINRLKPLYKLFPKMDLVDSNHGSLVLRKIRYHGLPVKVMKDMRDILEAPKGWVWHNDLIVKMSNGKLLYVCHGRSADVLKVSQAMGMCVAQGHYHERFEVRYWTSREKGLLWGVNSGCLIDNDSLAYSYSKLNINKPILGATIILDGIPRLIPMVLNSKNRWIGRIV